MRWEPGGSEGKGDGQCRRGKEGEGMRGEAGGSCSYGWGSCLGKVLTCYGMNDSNWAGAPAKIRGYCFPARGSPWPYMIASKAWRGGEGARTMGGYLATCMTSPSPPQ